MQIIHHPVAESAASAERVRIPVERLILAKRRWRGVAEDGREFGFDLEQALSDGAVVFAQDGVAYAVQQKAEPVLEVVVFGGLRGADAARLGWMIGNLHFPLGIDGDALHVADDPALRQLFERDGIAYTVCERVFRPLSSGHFHSHADDHHQH